jgi:hypothetical protein
VLAAAEMFFKVGAQRNRRVLIQHFIQLRQKLRARHFAPSWAWAGFASRLK